MLQRAQEYPHDEITNSGSYGNFDNLSQLERPQAYAQGSRMHPTHAKLNCMIKYGIRIQVGVGLIIVWLA